MNPWSLDSGHNLAASTRRSSTQHSPRHSLVSGPEEDDDTEKLRVLYNKAIETVQQADESLLMEDRQSNRFQVGHLLDFTFCRQSFQISLRH